MTETIERDPARPLPGGAGVEHGRGKDADLLGAARHVRAGRGLAVGGSIHRRLEALEARSEAPQPSDARRRMVAHLDRLAALRRGELGPEEEAEVAATHAALQERMASRRGGEGVPS